MGKVVKFRKRPRNSGQFRGQGNWSPSGNRKPPWRRRGLPDPIKLALSVGGLLSLAGLWWSMDKARAGSTFQCESVKVIDGDTFDCGSIRVRMTAIDAPEMPGHCQPGRSCTPGDPYASRVNLNRLMAGGAVQCRKTDTDDTGAQWRGARLEARTCRASRLRAALRCADTAQLSAGERHG